VASQTSIESNSTEDPGHLHTGAQSKSNYVSPSFFAMIGKEVSMRTKSEQPGFDMNSRCRTSTISCDNRNAVLHIGNVHYRAIHQQTQQPSQLIQQARRLAGILKRPLGRYMAISSRKPLANPVFCEMGRYMSPRKACLWTPSQISCQPENRAMC